MSALVRPAFGVSAASSWAEGLGAMLLADALVSLLMAQTRPPAIDSNSVRLQQAWRAEPLLPA
eukprot:scaffold338301_cov45-Prasinocladus_malaysianus.AAC.1